MSETKTYQGATYQRNGPGEPWVLVPNVGAPATIPGAFVPPDPARVAERRAEEARRAAADARATQAAADAHAAAIRAADKFAKEDTVAPPPGDITKTGEDYLATLPTALAGQVKALSDGRRAFPTGSALRSPQVQELIAAATQYDPTLDAANAATRVATRKKFTSGTTRDNITAINTALGHLGTLSKDAEKLDNRSWTTWNTVANSALSEFGDPRVGNFNTTAHAVVDELEKAFRGSSGTQAGIEEWKASLNSSQSPEQLRAVISKGVELLNSRLEALGQAYSEGMGKSANPLTFLNPHAQQVFTHLGPGGDGILPNAAPPKIGGGGGGQGGPTPLTNGGAGPNLTPTGGATKTVFDAETAAGLNALVQRQRPYNEAAAFAQSKGFPPPTPGEYSAALSWQKANPRTPYNASSPTRTEPTSLGERSRASGGGEFAAAAGQAAMAGFDDEAKGAIAALGGADYTQARDAANADKQIGAQLNPTAALLGNVAGGVGGAIGADMALTKFAPGALSIGAKFLGKYAPAATDAAYGAAYGAGENNDNRLLGAAEGVATAVPAGMAARGATRGLANVIAPPEGAFGPSYAQGVFPTIGQRFGKSGLAGRIVNTGEQALQSVPLLGSMVARSRQIPRDAFQTGAFNDALAEIGQQLPPGTGPGTDAHAFSSQAFGHAYDKARGGMAFLPDQVFQSEQQAFNQVLDNGTLDAAQAAQVRQRIATAVDSRLAQTGGALPGDAYKAAASDLAKTQRDWSKTDPLKADALGDFLTIFDNAARRNSDPNAVAMLDQADRGYAKLVRVQRASELGGAAKDAGTFSPNNLSAAVKQTAGGVRSGPYLRGEALSQDYADAGRGLADTLPNSGTAERLYTGQLAAGGTGAMFGAPAAIAAHPGALAPFALYAPGVNKAVSRLIAPRQYTLPPNVASSLVDFATQINNRAGTVGRLAVPGALGWNLQ